jgi:biopolymer transport protein ExbD
MAKKKKKAPSVDATSSADIAFMLLLFFLLTSSMDTDQGLPRRLPPPPEKDQKKEQIDIKKRNMLVVLINSNNQIFCGGNYVQLNEVKEIAKSFIANPADDPTLPEKVEEDVPFFGTVRTNKPHVISLQNDRGTQYQVYIDVQNELAAAYNELRDDASKSKWGKAFADLTEEQQKSIQTIYPQKISEAEPKNYGEKKK